MCEKRSFFSKSIFLCDFHQKYSTLRMIGNVLINQGKKIFFLLSKQKNSAFDFFHAFFVVWIDKIDKKNNWHLQRIREFLLQWIRWIWKKGTHESHASQIKINKTMFSKCACINWLHCWAMRKFQTKTKTKTEKQPRKIKHYQYIGI